MISLSSSSVLSTVLCSDPEQLAGTLPGARRRLLPLSGDFDLFQASLQLGHLRLVIVQRPPCASDGYLDQRQIGIALSMGDSRGLRLDGLSLNRPALVAHGLTIPHRICEPDALTIAALFLPDVNDDRGWPERTHAARVARFGRRLFSNCDR